MTGLPETPRYVVADSGAAEAVLRGVAGDGWLVRQGFVLSVSAPDVVAARLVLYGRVCGEDDRRLAVLAAVLGAGIVAVCDPGSPFGAALSADLARLGPVHQGVDGVPAGVVGRLVAEQRALLDRLAAGETIAAAAAGEFLSLRTANRRIAAVRALFGVRTTREAVLAYLRLR